MTKAYIITEDEFKNFLTKEKILVSRIHQDYIDDYQINDANYIRGVIKDKLNLDISASDAIWFWQWHSTDYDAGWLMVNSYSDDDIIKCFLEFVSGYVDREKEYEARMKSDAQ